MCEFFKDAAGSLVGGALAVGTGYWLFWVQRRSSAKDDFLATIDDLKAKLEVSRGIDASCDKTHVFYNESTEVLRRAVYKVRRHLRSSLRERLQKTFQDFEGQKQWFESPERVVALKVHLKGLGNPHPQTFLDDFLDRFYDCVA